MAGIPLKLAPICSLANRRAGGCWRPICTEPPSGHNGPAQGGCNSQHVIRGVCFPSALLHHNQVIPCAIQDCSSLHWLCWRLARAARRDPPVRKVKLETPAIRATPAPQATPEPPGMSESPALLATRATPETRETRVRPDPRVVPVRPAIPAQRAIRATLETPARPVNREHQRADASVVGPGAPGRELPGVTSV